MGYFEDDAGWSLVPGDWPPKGRRLASVAVVLSRGPRRLWLEDVIGPGEIPYDVAARLASEAGHSSVGWALPCATLVPAEGEDAVLVVPGETTGPVPHGPELDAELDTLVRRAIVTRPAEVATECRSHASGHISYFHCAVARRDEAMLVLEYRSWREGRVKGTLVPAGSRTIAAYREGMDHVAWRIIGPEGEHVLDLVHLAAEVRVGADRVHYRDMLLDVVRAPGGEPQIIDQEDLEGAEASGWVTPEEAAAVRKAGGRIALSFTEVYREIST